MRWREGGKMLELKLKQGSLEQICKDAQDILNQVLILTFYFLLLGNNARTL